MANPPSLQTDALVEHLDSLINSADGINSDSAQGVTPDQAKLSAWRLQVEILVQNRLKSEQPYFWPLVKALSQMETDGDAATVSQTIEYLKALKIDVEGKHLDLKLDEAAPKLLEAVLASLNLYLTIATAIVGLFFCKLSVDFHHPSNIFWSVTSAVASFAFGALAQSWIVGGLAQKKGLRESVLNVVVINLLRVQIVLLVASIVFAAVYWATGGKIPDK